MSDSDTAFLHDFRSVTSSWVHCPFKKERVKGCLWQFFYLTICWSASWRNWPNKKTCPWLSLFIISKVTQEDVSSTVFSADARTKYIRKKSGNTLQIITADIFASSLKCYHFRTCEGDKSPFNPPCKAERLMKKSGATTQKRLQNKKVILKKRR